MSKKHLSNSSPNTSDIIFLKRLLSLLPIFHALICLLFEFFFYSSLIINYIPISVSRLSPSSSLYPNSSLPQINSTSVSPQKRANLPGINTKHGKIGYNKSRHTRSNQSRMRQLSRRKKGPISRQKNKQMPPLLLSEITYEHQAPQL